MKVITMPDYKTTLPFFFVFLLVLSAFGESVIPDSDFEPCWVKAGATKSFYKHDLYGHIDGGAELFLEFGFEKLLVQRYQKDTLEIDLEIYEMTEPEAALGIYLMKCGRETPLAEIPARHTVNPFQLTVVKSNYFIQVNSFSGRKDLVPAMQSLVNQVLARIPDSEEIKLFSYLPDSNLIGGSELLIRGQYALQPLYTLGEGDILKLDGKIYGVVGSYRIDSLESYTLMVIPYPDEETAMGVFENLEQNLDPYLEIIDYDLTGFIFKDYQNRFGDVHLRNNILQIRFNLPEKPILTE